MSECHVEFDVNQYVGTITLNRPLKLNAFGGRMREDLSRIVREASRDDRVRVLVITGAGRAFCAGADISYMQELVRTEDWETLSKLVELGVEVVSTIYSLPKPVLAAVNGPAAGGGANLALACDLRFASRRASIGQTFNRIGLHPDWGGTYFLPQLVGPAKALELIFTAEMVDADEGLRLGLFNRVVEPEQLLSHSQEFAARLARKAPIALALAKQAVRGNDHTTLAGALALESANQMRCFKTQDVKEGIAAFLDKRPPAFHGN
jgi:2-(1,2-epoxy-1,2-dihydrophenyl)acetyl-CoA isomerase